MIAVQANELLERIAVLKSTKLSANEHQALLLRRQRLDEAKKKLLKPVAFLEHAAAVGVLSVEEVYINNCDSARESVEALARRFSEDPTAALSDDAFANTVQRVDGAARMLDKWACEIWAGQADPEHWERQASVMRALENAAEEMSPLHLRVRRQAELAIKLKEYAERPYVSVESWQRYVALADEFDHLEKEVGGNDGLPAGLLEFLQAANGTGATIGQLTEPVRAWLARHGISQRLRVRLR